MTDPAQPPQHRLRVRFTGRVQGVGFRATARGIARGLSVTGWVRNEPDGSVLMEVQGRDPDVAACLDQLAGRMGTLIRDRRDDRIPVEPGETGFEITR